MFNLEDCLAYLASKNAKDLAAALEKRVAPHGITRVQWMLLYYAEKNPGVTQKQLAEIMGITEPSVVRLIDRVEADGLLERIPHPDDRRIRTIVLTDKGKKLNRKVTKVVEQFKDDAIAGIPVKDMDTFREVLETMVKNVC